jgi:predicted nucleic acid-binding protein
LRKIVVDASSIGRALLPDERDVISEQIIEEITSATLVEPAHWGIECAGLILKAARRGRISGAERTGLRIALSALFQTAEIDLQTQALNAFDLGVSHDLSVYDAAYLDLAMRTGYPLLTQDKALLKAAKHLGVELIEIS